MSRVAIVSYWAPPQGAVASQRVLRLSRALLAAGHEVHWVTLDLAQLDGKTDPTMPAVIPPQIVRHGLGGPCLITKEAADGPVEWLLRTLAFKATDWFAVPDGYLEWTRRLRRNLARIIKEHAIDTAFFCLGPHGALMALPKLRRQCRDLRIVVDYRDLLSGNFWRQSSRESRRRKLLARERRALRAADALFVNTDEALRRFREVVQTPPDFPVEVMRNAADYDLADQFAGDGDPADLGAGIHIGYFGTIFPRRPLTPVLEGLARLDPDRARRFRLHLYTTTRDEVEADRARLGGAAAEAVVYHDPVPFGDALKAMRSMHALALVNGATEDDRIFVPGKLYDYLMARRPVLFVGAEGDAWRIVADCCGDGWCFRHDEPAQLDAALRRLAEGRPDDMAPNDAYRPEASFAPLLRLLQG